MIKQVYHKIKASGYTFLEQILQSGGNFVLHLWLPIHLGIEGYGHFALLWLFLMLALGILQNFLIKPAYAFYDKEATDETISAFLWVGIFFSGLGGCFWALSGYLYSKFPAPFLQLAGMGTAFLFAQVIRALFFTKKWIPLAAIAAFITQVIILISLFAGMGIIGSLFLGYASGSLMGLFVFYKKKPDINSILSILNQHWRYGRWLIATGCIQWWSSNHWFLVVEALLGSAALGIIRIMQNLMGGFNILLLVLENIVPLRMAQTFKQKGWRGLLQLNRKITIYILPFFITFLIFFIYLIPYGLPYLYEEDYTQHLHLLNWFGIAYVLIFLNQQSKFVLRSALQPQGIFWACLLHLLFSIFVANSCITSWDIPGFFVGIILGQFLLLVLHHLFIHFYNKTNYANHTLSIG